MGNISVRSPNSSPFGEDEIELRREDCYEGSYNEEGQYHGKGVLHYAFDDVRQRERYEGDWFLGKRHGKGTLSWSNGAIYQGTWKDDMLHGMGIFHLPSGLCYEGEFFENKFQGLGVLTWKEGKRYEGSWHANRHHGYGCLTYASNDQRKRVFYKGEWKNGKRHGNGTMKWANGAKYVGDWVNGKREGIGKHIFPSNQIYIGHWDNGRREGFGCRYFCNGDRFEGNWQRDKKHGPGVYIYAHGRRVLNYHENGKLDDSITTPQEVQSLKVLCIEKIATEERIVESIDTFLTPELALAVRTYRKNELKIQPQETPSGFMNHLQTMFFKFSRLSARQQQQQLS